MTTIQHVSIVASVESIWMAKKFASDKDDDGNITAQSKPYCVNCYGQKFAPKCHRCHNAIIGGDATISRIVVGNDEYCEGCFVCKTQGCGKSLKSGAYPVKDIHGTEFLRAMCNRMPATKYSCQSCPLTYVFVITFTFFNKFG